MLKDVIRRVLKDGGADIVGFAAVDRFESAPAGSRPGDLLPGAGSVISFAVRIPYGVLKATNRRVATGTWNMANSELSRLAYRISKLLEDQKFLAVPVSPFLPVDIMGNNGLSGDISHKHAAELAGIGRIGLSGLLITPEFGPRVRLISVITDAALESDPLPEDNFCDQCREKACIKACPVDAIAPDGKLDKIKCLDTYQAFGGRKLIAFLKELVSSEDPDQRLEKLKYPRKLELLEMHQFVRVGGVSCLECMRVCSAGSREP